MGDTKKIAFEQINMRLDKIKKMALAAGDIDESVRAEALREVRAIRGSLKAIGENEMEALFKRVESRIHATFSLETFLELVELMKRYISGEDVEGYEVEVEKSDVGIISFGGESVKESVFNYDKSDEGEEEIFVVLERGNERIAFPSRVVERVEDSGKRVRVITKFGIESGDSVYWGKGKVKEMKWRGTGTKLIVVDGKPAVLMDEE